MASLAQMIVYEAGKQFEAHCAANAHTVSFVGYATDYEMQLEDMRIHHTEMQVISCHPHLFIRHAGVQLRVHYKDKDAFNEAMEMFVTGCLEAAAFAWENWGPHTGYISAAGRLGGRFIVSKAGTKAGSIASYVAEVNEVRDSTKLAARIRCCLTPLRHLF